MADTVLILEIDDILTDYSWFFLDWVRRRYHMTLCPDQLINPEDDTVARCIDLTHGDLSFWRSLPPRLDGLRYYPIVLGLVNRVEIVTTRPVTLPGVEAETRRWLDRYGISYRKLAFSHDKTRHFPEQDRVILIDVDPRQCTAAAGRAWCICHTSPRFVNNAHCVQSWHDVVMVMKQYLQGKSNGKV